jgi:hypothetical protein
MNVGYGTTYCTFLRDLFLNSITSDQLDVYLTL